MKKTLLLLPFAMIFLAGDLTAQTNYSFPISAIISAGSAGVRLPNGTIARAARVATGTGSHSAASGTTNPDAMGGTFTGTSFLPFYVGSTVRNTFTIIETNSTSSVDNGVSNNCARSIGFRIFFDRPTLKISFLALDIDGFNQSPGNAEWVTGFGFNGATYVPYSQLIEGSSDPAAVAPLTINTSSPTHNWRTLISGTTGAAAATNLPASMGIQRGSGGGLSPDNLFGQVVFTPTDPNAAVTDFFLLFGLWQQPAGDNVQASGVSPIVVRVSPDFGDNPDTYKTLLASGGPSHGVVGTLGLGTLNNTKADGTPSAAANLDPDDDGITSVPMVSNDGSLSQVISTYSLTSSFFNNVGVAANYVAWIDWNNNGTFEASEAQTATTGAGATTGNVVFTWNNATLTGPVGRVNTYARIRVTTEAITTADAGGAFKDGEVEDYLVPFAIILPVRLTLFSGKTENNNVILNWNTENEINSSHFIIERSVDGRNFNPIGKVNANGNSSSSISYQFTDKSANLPGVDHYYYRLNQVDDNGRQSYSSTISISMLKSALFKASLMPNPVGNSMNLVLEGIKQNELIRFDIISSSGAIVYTEQISANGTAMVKTMPRPALNGGVYFYKVTGLLTKLSYSGKLVLQ